MIKLFQFKFILLILSIILIFNPKIVHSKEPIDFIKEVTSEASSILVKNLDKETKILKLRELAEENVDIKGIGYYTLGKHRKTIDKSQLDEYEILFKEYFLKTFSSRLSEYSDPKINVLSQEVLSNKYTMVSSVLIAKEDSPEVKINWRVYTKDPSQPLIRDLIIEGLSLARTQKEEFNSVIQSGDGNIEILFNNIKEFIKQ